MYEQHIVPESNLEDQNEILSLNLEELNVEELEQRLELSSAAPHAVYCVSNHP